MERQQQIAYQLDLFAEQKGNAIDHFQMSGGVSEGLEEEVLQVTEASKHERALTDDLMQHVCSSDNIRKAYKQVKQNDGSPGVDGQDIRSFGEWYITNGEYLRKHLLTGKYKPDPVKSVEIPKPDGKGKRQLGIPTVRDRVIQQAIYQVLNLLFDGEFSQSSYGFREGRNAHQGLKKSSEYIKGGRGIVVDIDLEKFFDRVNHDRLMHRLSQTVGDKVLLGLIRKYLQSGILTGGLVSQRTEGTPQGSPLSPLLSNIVLDELDKELEKRGHQFCRYADDCNIYVRTQKSGERVMQSIGKFIEERLKLKINREKSKVIPSGETKFLGYRIVKDGILTISPININRLKDKVRKITQRNRGVSLERVISELNCVLRGWLQYFRHSKWRGVLLELDGWIRRKLRCYKLKLCKNVYTIKLFLSRQGINETQAWNVAKSGKGWWRLSKAPPVSIAMNLKWFHNLGLFCLALNYDKLNN
ncbi:MAG: group II intron reverse transcriptase/maturase [Bacteroidota bacterium]|nr:group II intron reverse transcriptase/maturase [Bacteroidota bacterium]